MRCVSVRLHAVVIKQEGFATDDEGDYFDGEVDLDLVVDGVMHAGLIAKVKQAAGSSFADPLEVLDPTPYVGPIDYGRFRDCIERYVRAQVRDLLGTGPMALAHNLRFQNLRLPGEGDCWFGSGAVA